MLSYNFGYMWDTIPLGKFDDMRAFFRNNAVDRYKIIDPMLHQTYMNHSETTEYRDEVIQGQRGDRRHGWEDD